MLFLFIKLKKICPFLLKLLQIINPQFRLPFIFRNSNKICFAIIKNAYILLRFVETKNMIDTSF
jgi:hypothetical protein